MLKRAFLMVLGGFLVWAWAGAQASVVVEDFSGCSSTPIPLHGYNGWSAGSSAKVASIVYDEGAGPLYSTCGAMAFATSGGTASRLAPFPNPIPSGFSVEADIFPMTDNEAPTTAILLDQSGVNTVTFGYTREGTTYSLFVKGADGTRYATNFAGDSPILKELSPVSPWFKLRLVVTILGPGKVKGHLYIGDAPAGKRMKKVPTLQNLDLEIGSLPEWNTIGLLLAGYGAVANIAFGDARTAKLRALEVTQVVQDWKNSVPLIAGKETFVRLFVEAEDKKQAFRRYSPRLRGFRNGVELPESPLAPIKPYGEVAANAEEYRELVGDYVPAFKLPETWCQGQLELAPEIPDWLLSVGDYAVGAPASLPVKYSFESAPIPTIELVPIEVSAPGDFAAAPDDSLIAPMLKTMKRLLPCPDVNHSIGSTITEPEIVLNDTVNVMKRLRLLRSPSLALLGLTTTVGTSGTNTLDGQSATGELAGWAIVRPEDPFTPVHELSHGYGRPHPMDGALEPVQVPGTSIFVRTGSCEEKSIRPEPFPFFSDVNCNVPNCSKCAAKKPRLGPIEQGVPFQMFGFDLVGKEVTIRDPYCYYELMSYCGGTDQWISSHTYTKLLAKFRELYSTPSGPAFGRVASEPATQSPLEGPLDFADRVLIQGVANLGNATTTWNPIQCVPPLVPTPAQEPGAFTLRSLDAFGLTLDNFSLAAELASEADLSATNLPFPFSLVLTSNPAVRHYQLLHSNQVIGSISGSLKVPTVQLLSPAGGEVLTTNLNISWQMADGDGDALRCLVLYSPDGGLTWRTLLSDYPGNNLVVPLSNLPGSTNGLIRVQVSDGFYCVAAQHTTPITVPDQPPRLIVFGLESNNVFYAGQRVSAEAMTFDAEDRSVPANNVQWFSDRAGLLATGPRLSVSAYALGIGNHLITCSATDTAGHAVQKSAPVRIERYFPPAVGWVTTSSNAVLEVLAEPGGLITVEGSTNLVHWLQLTQYVAEAYSREFPQFTPQASGASFFRARIASQAPAIVQSPASASGLTGSSIALTSNISGDLLSYQWYFNGQLITNANTASLTLTNAQPFQSGQYWLVAMNELGAVTSAVASVTVLANQFETLHWFGTNSLDGVNGWGPLALDSDGWLYGCARNGGISNAGTIFKYHTYTRTFVPLRRFNTTNDGAQPLGGLLLASDGLLYGTCFSGGTNNSGTVFRVDKNGSNFVVLRHFLSSGDNRNPAAELIEGSDGRLYGTAYNGGGFGRGGLFSLNKDGTGYTIVYGFRTTGSDGQGPVGLLEGPGGNLFGTTELGGVSNRGCIFRISPYGTNYARLRDFGAIPAAAEYSAGQLLLHPDGWLYGTTYGGGSFGLGTVYKMAPDGSSFITILKSFGFTTNDATEPRAGLTLMPSGRLLGTTRIGGTANQGTVYTMNTNGAASFQIVTSFTGTNGQGARSRSPMRSAPGDVYYGTTFGGGTNDLGTIFRVRIP